MKYTVLTPIRHGGERLAVGASISLTEKEALGLISCSAIAKPSDPRAQALMAEVKAKADEAEAKVKAEAESRAGSQQIAKDAREKAEADAKKEAGEGGPPPPPVIGGEVLTMVNGTPGAIPSGDPDASAAAADAAKDLAK